jgi:hypothetical protein
LARVGRWGASFDNRRAAGHIIAFDSSVNASRDENNNGGKSNRHDLDVCVAASAHQHPIHRIPPRLDRAPLLRALLIFRELAACSGSLNYLAASRGDAKWSDI